MQHEMSPRSASHTGSNIITSKPYTSIFFHNDRSAASPPNLNCCPPNFNSSSNTTDEQNSRATVTAAAAVSSLNRLMSQHKELLNRHAIGLSQLHKTFKEAETLRQENTNLRVANYHLSDELNFLLQATKLQRHLQNAATLSESLSGFEGMNTELETDNMMESPTSVMRNETSNESQNAADPGRVTLPKSISVRSNGYLKISPSSGGTGSSGSSNSSGSDPKLKRDSAKIPSPSTVSGTQKVYVRGRKDGIELEVYNQGMVKTELCNKWQETGNCPYGDHCQFAHGIQQLRPVIRHPRYKTEVCRMVLAGDPCPYGHRCHFRHALTDQEKLMLPLRLD